MKNQNKKRFPQVPRLPGESEQWYSRFISYALQGPGRSMLKVFQDEQPPKAPKGPPKWLPSGWKKRTEEFRWKERAEQFDRDLTEQKKTAFIRLKDRETRLRQRTYREIRRFLDAVLCAANPITFPPAAIASLGKVLLAADGPPAIKGGPSNDDSPEAFAAALKRTLENIRPPGGGSKA